MILHYTSLGGCQDKEKNPGENQSCADNSGSERENVVILLHGLFGMGANLGMLAKPLAETVKVLSLDLRNHGRSFRANSMSFNEMANDVLAVMDNESINSAFILGHSLGGKVAMQLALQQPKRVRGLLVGDIAPVAYSGSHDDVFSGLKAVNLQKIASRRDAEVILRDYIVDTSVRLFIIKNLYRNSQGKFDWRINVLAIESCYSDIRQANVSQTPFTGPTIFIKGEKSNYIQQKYYDDTVKLFPKATFKIIQNTGHWLHAEKPVAFNRIVKNFITAHL